MNLDEDRISFGYGSYGTDNILDFNPFKPQQDVQEHSPSPLKQKEIINNNINNINNNKKRTLSSTLASISKKPKFISGPLGKDAQLLNVAPSPTEQLKALGGRIPPQLSKDPQTAQPTLPTPQPTPTPVRSYDVPVSHTTPPSAPTPSPLMQYPSQTPRLSHQILDYVAPEPLRSPTAQSPLPTPSTAYGAQPIPIPLHAAQLILRIPFNAQLQKASPTPPLHSTPQLPAAPYAKMRTAPQQVNNLYLSPYPKQVPLKIYSSTEKQSPPSTSSNSNEIRIVGHWVIEHKKVHLFGPDQRNFISFTRPKCSRELLYGCLRIGCQIPGGFERVGDKIKVPKDKSVINGLQRALRCVFQVEDIQYRSLSEKWNKEPFGTGTDGYLKLSKSPWETQEKPLGEQQAKDLCTLLCSLYHYTTEDKKDLIVWDGDRNHLWEKIIKPEIDEKVKGYKDPPNIDSYRKRKINLQGQAMSEVVALSFQ